MKHYDREIETLRELLNDSFYENPYFVPITGDEFRFQIGPFKRVMDPAISLVAEMDGVPVAFCVTLPDFNPLLKKMNGSMGPRAIATFLARQSARAGRGHYHHRRAAAVAGAGDHARAASRTGARPAPPRTTAR